MYVRACTQVKVGIQLRACKMYTINDAIAHSNCLEEDHAC